MDTKHTLNELLVGMFNYILYLEERNIKEKGVTLSMTEVHLLESIERGSDNTMSHIAYRSMITQGTLTTSTKRLVEKGYIIKYRDEKDKRVYRLKNTQKAKEVLKIHDEFHRNMIDKAVADLNIDENILLIETLENILAYFRHLYGDERYEQVNKKEK